ncbi:MAG TPA: carboxypeptidase-like regulatory domain-containing protein [Candidatus Acidoferrum sp.]|nr:carboxypeptidase-like regulatory domain-containing protein [Candidatus Acidoferrum sp.]
MNRKLLTVVVLLAAVLLFQVGVARADLYGSIRGTVTDATGAGLPDAVVTATNMATNASQQVRTQPDGSYTFLQLAIGDYSLKIEKASFQTFAVAKIHLDVNTVYTQDAQMTVGAINQQITVEANAAQVETTTPQLGTVISSQQIVDLPLIGRNWIQLQQLQPGVVGASDRFGASGPGTNFATNGGESQFNVFLIDGTDTNDLVLNTQTLTMSEDAVAEFRMVTSTINPEYARSSGAIVDAITKSGTNRFHGDAFEFYRDTFLDSTNYFATAPNPFHENQFGGTIGGPVIKNHTFFFFSYQGIREGVPLNNNGVTNGLLLTPVFTQAQRGGNFSGFDFNGTPPVVGPPPIPPVNPNVSPFPLFGDSQSPCPVSGGVMCPAGTFYGKAYAPNGTVITNGLFSTGMIPTQDYNSLSSALLNKYVPLPTPGQGNNFLVVATQTESDNQYLARIDQNFNSKDSLWGTWYMESTPTEEPIPFIGATLPGFGEIDQQHFKLLSLSWTHVFNDHMLNELRAGYNRFNFGAVFPQNPTLPSAAPYNFQITPQDPSGAGLPVIQVTGLFNLGFSEDGPQPRIDQVYQGGDNFQLIEGRHTIKLGIDIRHWEVWNPFLSTNDGFYQFQPFGTYSTGNTGVDFLLGIPALYIQGSGSLENTRTRQYYSYAQDQFKLRSNLTFIFGSGWTVDTPQVNYAFNGHGQVAFSAGQQSVVFPGAPIGVVYQGDPGVNSAGPTQWKNFGPRLGVAYSPDWGWLTGGPNKTSIRAGFGIYYDKSETEQADQVVGMPPFATTVLNGALAPGVIVGVNPGFKNPYADIATGAVVPSPFPFHGFPSNVNFATTPGLEPIWGFCCASVAPNTTDPRVTNYNLTVQRQFPSNTILTVGYVGSQARHLTLGLPQNIVTGLGINDTPINLYNINVYGSIDTLFSEGNSRYNGLQISVDKRMSHGLQFLISYTYSHSIDDTSGFENSSFGTFGSELGGFGGSIRASNPYCFPKCDWASSIYDARQRLVLSYVYHLPGVHGNWMVSRLTQGWTVTGITTFQTGFPFDVADLNTPSGGCDLGGDFSCWDGPNQVAPVSYLNPRVVQTINGAVGHFWFNPNSFAQVTCAPSCPAAGVSPTSVAAYGDTPRNALRGPGLNNWNFVLYKDTSISESTTIQLRLEAYNVFNHTQFDPAGLTGNVSSGNFGQILGAHDPRLMQIAAKFIF